MADLKSINSVAAGSLKSFNGVAAASLKAIAGLSVTPPAWDVSKMTYTGKYKDFSAQSRNKTGFALSETGNKAFVLGSQAGTFAYIYQYTLSTPWDISTTGYDSVYKDVTAQVYPNTRNISFSTDGTKLYYLSGYSDTVYQYTLSTPWDMSTASYDSKYKDFSAQSVSPMYIKLSADGAKAYVEDSATNKVYQYTLSTPWDISTASYDSKYKDFSAQSAYGISFAFSTDGKKVYHCGYTTSPTYYRKVYQYTLSTPWDISTASYDSKYKSLESEISSTVPYDIALSSEGTGMYLLTSAGLVYQYGY